MRHFIYLLLIILVPGVTVLGKTDKKDTQKEITKEKAKGDTIITSSLVDGLKFRSIGPAWCSGRIADLAVNPKNPKEYFTVSNPDE